MTSKRNNIWGQSKNSINQFPVIGTEHIIC
jgi:hypothetical protein